MPILTKAPVSSATRNFGYGDIPFKSRCLAAHFFGVDQASSIFNYTGGAALEVPGVAPTYDAKSVVFGPGSYFRTPFLGNARDRFALIVSSPIYRDSCFESQDSTFRFPPIYGPAASHPNGGYGSYLLHWNTDAQFLEAPSGLARLGIGGAADINSATNPKLGYAFPPVPIADPDGTWQDFPTPMAVASGPTDAYLYAQSGRVMRSYTVPQSGGVPPASKTTIGNTGAVATTKIRMHSFFEWTYLNPTESLVALQWAGAQAHFDGFRNSLYWPDREV